MSEIILPKDMQLGDIVQLNGVDQWEYSTCTVKQIKDGYVTLFRPFVHTNNFSYTGGVICYIGIEESKISVDSHHEYLLFRRVKIA